MTRSELVAALAERAGVPQKDADAVLAAFAETSATSSSRATRKSSFPAL